MNPIQFPRARVLAAGALLLLLGACSTPPAPVLTPAFQPANVHREVDKLPAKVRRVALLPLASAVTGSDAAAACVTLQPVLQAELGKLRLFETVLISPEQLLQWTGRESWRAEEPLPRNFLQKIRESLACEAVLFARLTAYRAYPPPATGWSMKLVDSVDGKVWWSVDEVFDSAEPAVVAGARRYSQQHIQTGGPAPDPQVILQSPTRFGQYTLSAVLATMPGR